MKTWKKSINLLRKPKEKIIKQVAQTTQTIQDLKTAIEAIKKTQTVIIPELENLGKRTESSGWREGSPMITPAL